MRLLQPSTVASLVYEVPESFIVSQIEDDATEPSTRKTMVTPHLVVIPLTLTPGGPVVWDVNQTAWSSIEEEAGQSPGWLAG